MISKGRVDPIHRGWGVINNWKTFYLNCEWKETHETIKAVIILIFVDLPCQKCPLTQEIQIKCLWLLPISYNVRAGCLRFLCEPVYLLENNKIHHSQNEIHYFCVNITVNIYQWDSCYCCINVDLQKLPCSSAMMTHRCFYSTTTQLSSHTHTGCLIKSTCWINS